MSDELIKPDGVAYEEAKKKAKKLYFDGVGITDIAKICKLKHATVKSWVYGQGKIRGWKGERFDQKNELIKHLTSNKRDLLIGMSEDMIYLISKAIEDIKLKAMKDGGAQIGVRTAAEFTKMLMNLDQLISSNREEETNRDSQVAAPATLGELKERLMNDPYADVEDTK